MRRLQSYIGGHNELILVILASLKLFNTMSKFAAGQHRMSVLENFSWEKKKVGSCFAPDNYFAHSRISPSPNMRRRYQGTQTRLQVQVQAHSTPILLTFCP